MPHQNEDDSTELLRRMTAESNDVVDKVLEFPNDDVPNYLQNLERFEEMSRKVSIFVQ